MPNPSLTHGRAIASANHLHALGHISQDQRDSVVSKSKGAIAAMAKARPKTPKATGVTTEGTVKVKTKADKPTKRTTPNKNSVNQPYV